MFALGSVPETIGSVTLILSCLYILVASTSAIYLLCSMFVSNYTDKCVHSFQLFGAGKQMRSAAVCSSVLLFLIANMNSLNTAKQVLNTLSGIFRILALGSLVPLAVSIAVIIVASIRGIRDSIVVETRRKMWVSSLLTYLFCYMVSYFLG